MISLEGLKNLKNRKEKILKDGVYNFFIENVNYQSDRIDKNNNQYEMWKFELRLTDRNFKLIKNVLVYDNDGVNDMGKEQLEALIALLDIDFDNLSVKESELKDFLTERLKDLEVVSTVYTKNGRSEVAWLYSLEEREYVLEKFQRRNAEMKKPDDEVTKIEKVDEPSPNEAHQILENRQENEVKVEEEKRIQSNVNATDDINYTDFIKFD
ncbi:hypothetical protein [Sporosarcina sp. FSL K6-3457]|uniref:hypothetical protein n=1 Tax=Sporosarcina sp. FSL K6-3457 TaxID=2978204 RepID=UPI0030F6C441